MNGRKRIHSEHNLRPWRRREALENIISELLSREVAVLQQSTSLDLDIANRTKFLNQSTEWMERTNRLQSDDISLAKMSNGIRSIHDA